MKKSSILTVVAIVGLLNIASLAQAELILPRSATGDLISFTLAGGGVQAGQTSMWLIVDTNAPADIGNTIQFSGGDFSSPNLTALGPAAPEPGTLVLLGIGAVGMAGHGWRGRKLTNPAA